MDIVSGDGKRRPSIPKESSNASEKTVGSTTIPKSE
jgi:hypothetical protein